MNKEDYELTVMDLITNAGQAKSESMSAIHYAKNNDFAAADVAMEECGKFLRLAHGVQTRLIGLDEGEGKVPVTLVMVHAQDHLMNAVLMKDLAQEFIDLYKRQA
ncbi:PTS lactose/cellobiose transporter subunit IIA [Photobacterium makurazakiensis]|uniref:PTS lactose/cellobiose transporter subunit IIA n=1 Tax=Photobacterium TaxID=657 RepID=UPI003D0DB136